MNIKLYNIQHMFWTTALINLRYINLSNFGFLFIKLEF